MPTPQFTARDFDAARAELARRSLVEFVRQAWHVVEPGTLYVHNWHIEAICQHLQAVTAGQIEKLLVNVPPGTMKSLLTAVFWPCWEWATNPRTRWLFASYGEDVSVRDSMKCRAVMQSDWYRRNWGGKFKMKADQNQKTKFENDKTGWRIATSVGGRGTGEHPDRKVVDDPVKADEAHSLEKLRGAIRWWDETMSTRGQTRNASSVIVMQRLSQLDLSGHVLERGGYEHLMIPMEYDPARSCVTCLGPIDKRTTEGELLWPELFPAKRVADTKINLGTFGAAGQYQQQPVPTGGAIFHAQNFRSFRIRPFVESDVAALPQVPGGLNAILAATPPQPKSVRPAGELKDERAMVFELCDSEGGIKRVFGWDCWWFQTVDTAMKTKEQNDYTAVGTFIVTPDRELLVYSMIRGKIEVPKQYPFLVEQRRKMPWLSRQYIEDAASGTGLLQQGQADGLAFSPLKAATDKIVRSGNVATLYEQGKVYHLAPGCGHDTSWLSEFEGELLMFPRGAHDDQVDVLSHAGNVLVDHAQRRLGIREFDESELPSIQELLGEDFLAD